GTWLSGNSDGDLIGVDHQAQEIEMDRSKHQREDRAAWIDEVDWHAHGLVHGADHLPSRVSHRAVESAQGNATVILNSEARDVQDAFKGTTSRRCPAYGKASQTVGDGVGRRGCPGFHCW